MKVRCISLLCFLIIVLSGIGLIISKNEPVKEYLRIHVRANSNTQVDQDIKYAIKDEVVNYLTPFIAECKTKAQAKNMLSKNLKQIENIANAILSSHNFNYKAKASVRVEEFPFRAYNGVSLEQGFYEALILELGEAKGDNWWCVVYPPLCFVGQGQNYIYKSKILDVINDFFCKEK